LYMPINCDLKKEDVYVLHYNYESGEEIEECLSIFENLDDIEQWSDRLLSLNN